VAFNAIETQYRSVDSYLLEGLAPAVFEGVGPRKLLLR